MKRKKWVIAAVAAVLLCGYTAGIYGQTNGGLTQRHLMNPNEAGNKETIAQNVLEDTGRSDLYELQDLQDIAVYYGNVLGTEGQDAVISVSFGPKNTVVAAYTPDGNVYEFIGDVGNFYNVRNIQFVPIPNLKKEILIVRELTNENIGAYESTDLIRGFIYDETGFRNVLNTPARINASWNALWDLGNIQDESQWRRVTETTESAWDTGAGDMPQLEIVRYQNFLVSEDADRQQVPGDSSFAEDDGRVVTERFFWSEKWRRFILAEAMEKATGQAVAIIENRDASPYALAGYEENSYRIMREDGTEAIVKADALEWTGNPLSMAE